MKPAPLTYLRPSGIAEATEMLVSFGGDASVIAGGQSLVPLMNLRLAQPTALIDVSRIDELRSIEASPVGVHIGAAMTETAVLRRPEIIPGMVIAAVRQIGHVQIRSRGTVGGSICHNDPAAEWPALLHALDAVLVVRGSGGPRQMLANEFQGGPLMNSLETGDVLTGVVIPEDPSRWGFAEIARRSGDFALVGAMACKLSVGWRVVVFGAGNVPQRLAGVEAHLDAAGSQGTIASLVEDEVTLTIDLHGSASYRARLASGLVEKVVAQACA